ncbi:Kv channel-interacting protein 4 isoform X2 [Bombyx mori]|uniref:Kv channel-interacting protein 4 isoform X2 n=1 Tax=Bombyx mori TaxID=7091 RepID=UPI000B3C5144
MAEEEYPEAALPTRHRPEALSALARSSRFTTHEIKLMYRGFKQECPSGAVDEEAFKNIFCQFFPLGDATQYAHYVFNTIKHKQSGRVNFEEFLGILSRVARGSVQEKLSWVFALYDVDVDRHERRRRSDSGRAGALVQPGPRAAAVPGYPGHRVVIRARTSQLL